MKYVIRVDDNQAMRGTGSITKIIVIANSDKEALNKALRETGNEDYSFKDLEECDNPDEYSLDGYGTFEIVYKEKVGKIIKRKSNPGNFGGVF